MKMVHSLVVRCGLLAFSLAALLGAQSKASQACYGQKVIDSHSQPSANFGHAVGLEGESAVVGAPRAKIGTTFTPGGAFVFERFGEAWIQTARLLPGSSSSNDEVGNSVSISGNRILVGAPGHRPSGGLVHAGAAYVFERQGGAWVQSAKLVASDPHPQDRFGVSVAIDGDTALVGANGHPQGGWASGAAYVFERVAGTWVQTQRLASSNLRDGDAFGWSTAIDGDWLVVGAMWAEGITTRTGAAYVFRRTASGWVEADKLEAWDGVSTQRFGHGVSIHGERIAVGAPIDGNGVGAVYLYEYDGLRWSFLQKLLPPDATTSSSMGRSVLLDGDQVLAGAPINADGIVGSGSAYLFQHDGSEFVYTRKLRASDAAPNDFFGHAVALSGGSALVGVYADDDACPSLPNCESGSAWFFRVPEFARGECFGASCPCANIDRARGCRNSRGRGAALFGCGSPSVAADDLAFGASGLLPGEPALLFRGTQLVNGGQGTPFGDGLRCAGGALRRLAVRNASPPSGEAAFGPGLALQGTWQPGDTLHFQAWYRDPQASPCASGFNTTNSIQVTFEP